jgi:cytosine/adenosine deaminase-related metal-dependent hydrolase
VTAQGQTLARNEVVAMWGIKGRIVPMASDTAVAATDTATFHGRVWIDEGHVVAVTHGTKAGPPGATVVDVGESLVLPGFVDLHNHLAYDTLPLWTQPDQKAPFLHHNSWPGESTYASNVTWPAYAFITAAPAELLAFVEAKAIVGGTTTIQGSPPKNHPRDGWLVRNVEDEAFGEKDKNLVYASTLTMKPAALADRANKMKKSLFIYHCAEGQPGTVVAKEYRDAAAAGCLKERLVAVHASAVPADDFAKWDPPGAIAWSPFSNYWLYGLTTDVPAARAQGITICLGSDWAPSGTKHVLGEAKVARLVSDKLGWGLTDADLVRMMTANPGDVLERGWHRQAGRLQPGALADVVVIDAKAHSNAFKTVVDATEKDVRLVVVDGEPRYGTKDLMKKAKATRTTAFAEAGADRVLSLSKPDDKETGWVWQDVIDRLEAVRAHPRREIEGAHARLAAFSGRLDDPDAPLRLALDMPSGVGPVGGLPKDLGDVVVPPLESLTHDTEWLASVHGRGFHGGLLDGLGRWYQ